jgi:hypothetical protein
VNTVTGIADASSIAPVIFFFFHTSSLFFRLFDLNGSIRLHRSTIQGFIYHTRKKKNCIAQTMSQMEMFA